MVMFKHQPPATDHKKKGPGLKAFTSPHLPLAVLLQSHSFWSSVFSLSPNPNTPNTC